MSIQDFGFDALRPFQQKVYDYIVKNPKSNIFILSPTSSGKSLCFQYPGWVGEGLTVVISPLKSLIYDQITSLNSKEMNACVFPGDRHISHYRFVYTTPETLVMNDSIMTDLKELYSRNKIQRFVFDEAHCVSHWGHDFRPKYLRMNIIKKCFPKVPVMALTATATELVVNDILEILMTPDAKKFSTSFYRDNLNIKIWDKNKDTKSKIAEYIDKHNEQTGIIYCSSKKNCEDLASFLKMNNINCEFYHAGMSKKKREHVQTEWVQDNIKVIIATIAFGMGIDKANVRYVIHFNMPTSTENYYQEIGRAGRDGLRSNCIMCLNKQDICIYTRTMKPEKKQKVHTIYNILSNKVDCIHYLISHYLGDKTILGRLPFNFCSNCCNCKKKKKNIIWANIQSKAQLIINSIIRNRTITYYKLAQITQFDRDTLNRIMLYLISQKFIKKIVYKKHEELLCYNKAQDIINNKIQFKIPKQILFKKIV